MNRITEQITGYRKYLLREIEGLTTVQLNKIPEGFNNNIIWNIIHLVATQQTICYTRAGMQPIVDAKYISSFLPGTKPLEDVSEEDIENIKGLFLSTIEKLETDLDEIHAKEYTPSVLIPKIYGFEVTTIDQSLEYLLYHEGQHAGYVLALKRLV
jgi:hypothetical protein